MSRVSDQKHSSLHIRVLVKAYGSGLGDMLLFQLLGFLFAKWSERGKDGVYHLLNALNGRIR